MPLFTHDTFCHLCTFICSHLISLQSYICWPGIHLMFMHMFCVHIFVHWHVLCSCLLFMDMLIPLFTDMFCVNTFVHWHVLCSYLCSQTCSVLMPLFTDMFYDSLAHWHVFAVDAFVQEHVTVHTTRREWTVKPVTRGSLVMLFMPKIARRKVSPFPFSFSILFLQEIGGQEIIRWKAGYSVLLLDNACSVVGLVYQGCASYNVIIYLICSRRWSPKDLKETPMSWPCKAISPNLPFKTWREMAHANLAYHNYA